MEKAKVFLLGMIVAVGLMFLIEARHEQIGKYQAAISDGAVVTLDTTTGQTYWQVHPRRDIIKGKPLP